MCERESPQTEVGGGVRHHAQHELNSLDSLKYGWVQGKEEGGRSKEEGEGGRGKEEGEVRRR